MNSNRERNGPRWSRGYTRISAWILPLLLIGAFLHFAIIVAFYSQFTIDDAYITFRYAHNLAQGNGLVFNIGDPVEGFSNFSWLVLLSGFDRLGVSMMVAAKVLGILSALGTLIYLTLLTRRYVTDPAYSFLGYAGAFLLLLSYGFASYTVSGLETIFFLFLLTAGLYYYVRNMDRIDLTSSIFFAIMALTRPEGILFFGILTLIKLAFLKSQFFRWRNILNLAIGVIPFLAYLAFRFYYFHALTANSVVAKYCIGSLSFLFGIVKGLRYDGLFFATPLALLLVIPCILAFSYICSNKELRALLIFFLLATTSYTIYGGDWMSFFRLFLHIITPLVVVGITAVAWLVGRGNWFLRASPKSSAQEAQRIAFSIVGLVLLIASVVMSANELIVVQNIPSVVRAYGQFEAMGLFIHNHARPDDVLVYGGIGTIGYYSQVRIRDTLGLVDTHIAHLPGCIASTDFGIPGLYPQRKFDVDYYFKDNPRFILIDSVDDVRAMGNLTSFELNEQLMIKDVRFGNYTRIYSLHPGAYLHLYEYDPNHQLSPLN